MDEDIKTVVDALKEAEKQAVKKDVQRDETGLTIEQQWLHQLFTSIFARNDNDEA